MGKKIVKIKILQKEITDKWRTIKLSSIFEFKNGLNKEKKFFGHGTPIINYMDVNRGGGLYARNILGRVDVNQSELSRFNVKRGDVFFTRTSETLDEIGLSAVALDDFKNTVFSGFVLRARPKENLLVPEYAQYCFRSSLVRKEIMEKSSYTTRALTSGALLNHVRINLPPLPEQNRIAAVLETWDQAIEKLTKKIEIKKNVKKSLMRELFMERSRIVGFKNGWKQVRIDSFCKIKRGGSPRPIESYMTDEETGLNWLKIGDISKESRYIKRTTGKIRKEGLSKTTVVREGDFILSNSMSFGRPYIMKTTACIHDGWLALQDISDEVNKSFLYYLLSSESVQNKFKSISAGSGVLNLKKESVAQITIQLPDIDEQMMIAGILSIADDEIEKLEEKISLFFNQKKYLLNNLLTGTIPTPESLSTVN